MGGGGSGRRRRAWLGGMTATTADFMDFILYMLYIFLIFSVHCHSGEFKIGLGGLNRVPASARVKAGMSLLPGGRLHCVIPYGL